MRNLDHMRLRRNARVKPNGTNGDHAGIDYTRNAHIMLWVLRLGETRDWRDKLERIATTKYGATAAQYGLETRASNDNDIAVRGTLRNLVALHHFPKRVLACNPSPLGTRLHHWATMAEHDHRKPTRAHAHARL